MKKVLAVLLALLLCVAPLSGPGAIASAASPSYGTERLIAPWEGNTAYCEAVLMVADGGLPQAKLLHPATRILSVTNAEMTQTYEENIDYTYQDGVLSLTSGSRAKFLTKDQLYPNGGSNTQPKKGGGYILWAEGSYFHTNQLLVTYEYDPQNSSWQGPRPYYAPEKLMKTRQKLANGEDMTVVLFGDSSSEGQNVSGPTGVSPYMPDYGQIVCDLWEDAFGSQITYYNTSLAGQADVNWALNNIDDRVSSKNPDLVILALGLDDGTFKVSTSVFQSKIENIMSKIKASNPDAEFILVSPMLANPESTFSGTETLYDDVLDRIAQNDNDAIMVDMTGVHEELLKAKSYQDMTGNNINHPNDYLNMWFAHMVAATMTEQEYRQVTIQSDYPDEVCLWINGTKQELPYRGQFLPGEEIQVKLAANDAEMYQFEGWQGIDETKEEFTYTVTENAVLSAQFHYLGAKNLAYQKQVITSNVISNGMYMPEYLTDGVTISQGLTNNGFTTNNYAYAANPDNPHDITIDLGAETTFNQVVLYPRTDTDSVNLTDITPNFPRDFEIQVSSDGNRFTTVFSIKDAPNPRGEKQEYNFDSVSGRYIRLKTTKMGIPVQGPDNTVFYVQLYEMEVYNQPNLALNKPVTASSDVNIPGLYQTKYLTDGIRKADPESSNYGYSSMPGSGYNIDNTITIDLQEERTVSQIALHPRTDVATGIEGSSSPNFPCDFQIQVSTDGIRFQTVYTVTDNVNPDGKSQYHSFDPVKARYIRLVTTKLGPRPVGEAASYLQLCEIEVFHRTSPDPNAKQTAFSDLVYVDDPNATPNQTLDLFIPETGEGPFPLVVFIHGGGWTMGDKDSPDVEGAKQGLEKGYAVATINYRYVQDNAPWPAQMFDCKAAIRYLRANADQFNLDPDHIAVWGGSAGAHLASFMGVTNGVSRFEDLSMGNAGYSSDVQAVVSVYGISNVLEWSKLFFDWKDDMFPNGTDEQLLDASPITHVSENAVPFMLSHGQNDTIVPVEQSYTLYEKLSTVLEADELECYFPPAAQHGEISFFNSRDTIERMYAFLQKHLKSTESLVTEDLAALLAEARQLQPDDYTEESFSVLQSAMAEAQNALETANKQSDIDSALSNLQNAIDGLAKREDPDGKVIRNIDVVDISTGSKISSIMVNEQLRVMITTNASIEDVKLFNEYDLPLGRNRLVVSNNEDGTKTFSMDFALGTVGKGRTLKVFVQDSSGNYSDSGEKVVIDITPTPVSITSFEMPDETAVNTEFVVHATTDTTATKLHVYNEYGLKMVVKDLTYKDVEGARYWTGVMSIGTKGTRSFNAYAANKFGVMSSTFAADIITAKP